MGIDKFNAIIDTWINDLSGFGMDQLTRKPDSKSWSLGQLYQHIIDDTNWYNEQIEISLANDDNATGKMTKEGSLLFERGSFEDVRIQGDPKISENVKQPISIVQLQTDLGKLKEETNKIWSRIQNTSKYGKSEHPGLGFLNCFEWIQFAEMHMRHHLKQKERIENFLKQGPDNY